MYVCYALCRYHLCREVPPRLRFNTLLVFDRHRSSINKNLPLREKGLNVMSLVLYHNFYFFPMESSQPTFQKFFGI